MHTSLSSRTILFFFFPFCEKKGHEASLVVSFFFFDSRKQQPKAQHLTEVAFFVQTCKQIQTTKKKPEKTKQKTDKTPKKQPKKVTSPQPRVHQDRKKEKSIFFFFVEHFCARHYITHTHTQPTILAPFLLSLRLAIAWQNSEVRLQKKILFPSIFFRRQNECNPSTK